MIEMFLLSLAWVTGVAAWLVCLVLFAGNMMSGIGWQYTLFGSVGFIVTIAVGITAIGMIV